MTLVEILVVVGMMGILATTLAAVFSAVVRATPDAEDRVTNARSLKGLVTWLPQDMDATPPDDAAATAAIEGFVVDSGAWSCSGPAPADSYNVVAMTWTEVGASTAAFHASYRYELVDSEWRMARYSCEDGGTARRQNMTSALPDWDISSPPARVEMCSTTVDTNGDCPSASVVTDPTSQPVESLKMTMTLMDGEEYTIDAAAKNPDENLADDPDAVTNFPPTAGVVNHTVSMWAGDTVVLDLYATHLIGDPEGDFLTSARDSFEPKPTGMTVTASDPLQVRLDADPTLLPGVIADPLVLIVSDSFGGAIEVTVTIEILPEPNDPPVALAPSYNLDIGQGETMHLPFDLTHGVFDPNDDQLSLQVLSWPAPLANKPQVQSDDPTLGDVEMTVTAKASAGLGPVSDPFIVRVTDEHGLFIDVSISLEVTAPGVNTAPFVLSSDVPVSMEAGGTAAVNAQLEHGASDLDLPSDIVWVKVDPAGVVPPGLTVETNGVDITVEADLSMVDGPAGSIPLLVTDWHGATAPATVTVTIVPPPPPPSDCVLGSLSVSQSPVGRVTGGNGPRELAQDVLVTLSYTGLCDGLVVKYDTGHPSGLGSGVGRVFPSGSPTTVVLVGDANGGTEKWTSGSKVLTASTTSDVSPDSVSTTLNVT